MADERPIWGIHMGLDQGNRPIQEGFVAIGWNKVGDLSKVASNREAFKVAVAKAYPNFKPGAIPVHAGTLYKFAKEMKNGDLVIHPSKVDRLVHFGLIEGAYIFDPGSDSLHPNKRKVRWTQHLPRAEFSQSALYEIGSAVTLFQVKNNSEEFIAKFEGKPFASEDVDEQTVEATSVNTEESAGDFVLKRLKAALDPYQFEKFIGHLLEKMGYHARVTQKSGDGGIDIIAHKDELGFQPPVIKVQVKQVLGNVGQPEVAQLYGHVEQREHGLFVTLGQYTTQAKQFERGKHNLRLIDGDELVNLIFSHYERFEPKYQMLVPLKKVYIPAPLGKEPLE